jgi:cytochrome c oxidase subunit 2
MPGFPLFPRQASTMAGRVDALFFFLLAVSAFFVIIIALLIIGFAIRYRRRTASAVGAPVHSALALEIFWTAIPLGLAMIMFVWGARLYVSMASPPPETEDVLVVGKQWMWKFQHMNGRREIDELHVPAGRAVRLTMTSEDVIHDLFIPAFRVKADVIPGRYSTIWFEATTPGRYHLFCSQYCGTRHSAMTGVVVVMDPTEYAAWLAGGGGSSVSPVEAGQKLFQDLACATCHLASGQGRGPSLVGLVGRKVTLGTGEVVTADEGYIRESVLSPAAKIAAGYQPIMPTFQGLVSEEQLLQLIEYIKSLGGPQPGQAAPAAAPAPRQGKPGPPAGQNQN